MIKVEERERIRRAYFVEKKSIRQIARELRPSRDTVKKAVESAEPARYVLKRARLAPVLGPYMGRIDELLEENERLPRKQRYTGRKIYQDVRAKGYIGKDGEGTIASPVIEDLLWVGVEAYDRGELVPEEVVTMVQRRLRRKEAQ